MNVETVVRLRAAHTRTDPYSQQDKPDWSKPLLEQPMITLAPAEPRPSSEPVEQLRHSVTSGWTLYLARGEDVSAQDRMRVRGEVYQVLGDPSDWMNEGIVVQVGRTEG